MEMPKTQSRKFRVGERVQLHAATDSWMRGDRYGVVVGHGRTRLYSLSGGGLVESVPVRVKLDVSGRVLRFHEENLFSVDTAL
jgi:hypothetical protein